MSRRLGPNEAGLASEHWVVLGGPAPGPKTDRPRLLVGVPPRRRCRQVLGGRPEPDGAVKISSKTSLQSPWSKSTKYGR